MGGLGMDASLVGCLTLQPPRIEVGHSSFKWTAAWPILQPPHLLSCFSCWWGIWISPSSTMAGPYSDTLSVSSEIHGSLLGAEILYFRKTCALLKVLGCPQHPLLSRSKFCSIWWICLVAFGWEHFLFHRERSFFLFFLLPSVDFKRNNKYKCPCLIFLFN